MATTSDRFLYRKQTLSWGGRIQTPIFKGSKSFQNSILDDYYGQIQPY